MRLQYRILIPLCLSLLVTSCKLNQSQLADEGTGSRVCSGEEALARLKGGQASAAQPQSLGLNEGQDPFETLVMNQTNQGKWNQNHFRRARSESGMQRDNLIHQGCSSSASLDAEIKCDAAARCGTIFPWMKINPSTEAYKAYHNAFLLQCKSAFSTYFTKNPEVGEKPSDTAESEADTTEATPNQESPAACRMPTSSDLTDVNIALEYCDAFGGYYVNTNQQSVCRCETGIKDMTSTIDDLVDCQGSNNAGFRACEKSGTDFEWNAEVGVCVCKSNEDIKSASALDIRGILRQKCSNTTAQKVPEATSPASTLPPAASKPVEPPKPVCTCVERAGRCYEVVDGKDLNSLTIQRPNPYGTHESCRQTGGSAGYDNLCNQMQIKDCKPTPGYR